MRTFIKPTRKRWVTIPADTEPMLVDRPVSNSMTGEERTAGLGFGKLVDGEWHVTVPWREW
jgi:hypothetical protein